MKENSTYIIGGVLGGIGGYLYWYYAGCSSGACPITASPAMSIIWGGLLGAILFNMIFSRKTTLPKAELRELLNNGALLLDVRTRGEYAGSNAKNSKNIPLGELGELLHTLDKEQNIIVVCASGMRSAKAVRLMKKNGFANCYNGGSWLNFK
jgi:rhodanese-related sulfurtransferase